MIERISQSFMKDMRAYLDKEECGNIIREKYVNDRLLDDLEGEDDKGPEGIDTMNLGSYFEFLLTGALPKNGKIPQPEMMKSGKDMLSAYRLAKVNAERVKKYLEKGGLKIVKYGHRYTHGRFEGTIDIVVEFIGIMKENADGVFELTDRVFNEYIVWHIGDKMVFDLKYSGFIGENSNYKSKHGWKWSPVQKKYHGTQAKHYYLITKLPFYFLVTSSKNDVDIELFYVPVDNFMLEQHVSEANHLFDEFLIESKIGFMPRPKLKKCLRCPLKEECKDKHDFPAPVMIKLEDDE